MSETGPNEGTLRVLPLLKEATAYIILRPFFRPLLEDTHPDYLAAEHWVVSRKLDRRTSLLLIRPSPARHRYLGLPRLLAGPLARAFPPDPSSSFPLHRHDFGSARFARRYGAMARQRGPRSGGSTPGNGRLFSHVYSSYSVHVGQL